MVRHPPRARGDVTRAILAAGLAMMATTVPAEACTVVPPYAPLSAIPQGTDRTLLVDVVATSFGRDGTIARVKIFPTSDARARVGSIVSIPYLVAPCPDRREPRRSERLAVYLRGGKALGWATPAEAARFDRRFRPVASLARPPHR